jgi:cyclase
MRGRVRDYYLSGKNKNETKSGLVSEMLEWFPVPPERKAKIESQIKSGLNRVFREIQREEDEKSGKVTTVVDDEEEYDE